MPRLDDRVLATLEGSRGRVAFSGLRRVLRAHPESLSRALHRLEREGLVERVDGGYRSLVPPPRPLADGFADRRPIAEVALPPGTTPDSVAGRLGGRWFGDLRWVGEFAHRPERLLVWARRDGTGTVLLGVGPRTLRVYLRGSGSGDDPPEAEDAAYELLYHAAQAIRPAGWGGSPGTAYLLLATPGPTRLPVEN